MKKFFIILFAMMSISCLINNIYWLSKGFKDVKSLVWGFIFSVLFAIVAIAVANGEKIIDKIDDIVEKIIEKR